jgi:hypothetical protein
MDAVQLDLAGSDRSVVFVRVRANPTSQVLASFRVQWTNPLRTGTTLPFFTVQHSVI